MGRGIVADKRGGYAVGDARRRRILDVALEEFGSHGYRGASLARIAGQAGLSQPGLLHHFPSKAELLIAVLEHRDELDGERFSWGGDGALSALEALVRMVELNAGEPQVVRLFSVMTSEATSADHPAHSWARARYRAVREQIAGHMRAGVELGELRPGIDAEMVADRLIAVMDGLQLQWLVDPEAIDMPAVFRGYVAELIETHRG